MNEVVPTISPLGDEDKISDKVLVSMVNTNLSRINRAEKCLTNIENLLFDERYPESIGAERMEQLYFNVSKFQLAYQKNTVKILELGLRTELLKRALQPQKEAYIMEINEEKASPQLLDLRNKLLTVVESKLGGKAS